jgi:two-component system, sensor histidine kinase
MMSNLSEDSINSYIFLLIEQGRLQAIKDYQLLHGELDEKIHSSINSLVKVAKIYLEKTIGFVSIVGSEEIKIIANCNFKYSSIPRNTSFCTWTIDQDDVLVIEDSLLDTRFCKNQQDKPEEDRIRFYSGFPLKSPSGYKIGTVCLCDSQPGKFTNEQKEFLKDIGRQIVDLLELDKKSKDLIRLNREKMAECDSKDQQIANKTLELLTSLNNINQLAGLISENNPNSESNQVLSLIQTSCQQALNTVNKYTG